MPQLYLKKPIFRAANELEQLDLIFRLCGTPTPSTWSAVTRTPLYDTVMPRKVYPRRLQEQYKPFVADTRRLRQCLQTDDRGRARSV